MPTSADFGLYDFVNGRTSCKIVAKLGKDKSLAFRVMQVCDSLNKL